PRSACGKRRQSFLAVHEKRSTTSHVRHVGALAYTCGCRAEAGIAAVGVRDAFVLRRRTGEDGRTWSTSDPVHLSPLRALHAFATIAVRAASGCDARAYRISAHARLVRRTVAIRSTTVRATCYRTQGNGILQRAVAVRTLVAVGVIPAVVVGKPILRLARVSLRARQHGGPLLCHWAGHDALVARLQSRIDARPRDVRPR